MTVTTGIPAIVCAFTMLTALYLHVLLERIFTRDKPSLKILHLPNFTFSWLMYGLPYIVLRGFIGGAIFEEGWLFVLYHAFLVPLPILIPVYLITAPLFHRALKRYVAVEGSNVIYIKRKLY
ncbi:hypothetical protein CR205_15695 [Alteribacter lacisalsi]|uniref:Uncharacterized protein n=1 Tax=Alteribacter lacisalsi TaxID=2045244 RepID=A0A2W0H3R9_9BACI|nr:hypothetical protein [Alteribacter lacisalsi]PYZ95827.1 hypothetical protein CR205_15695 [Alteribacter lacisalsi]